MQVKDRQHLSAPTLLPLIVIDSGASRGGAVLTNYQNMLVAD